MSLKSEFYTEVDQLIINLFDAKPCAEQEELSDSVVDMISTLEKLKIKSEEDTTYE